jgi:hypothetical protein
MRRLSLWPDIRKNVDIRKNGSTFANGSHRDVGGFLAISPVRDPVSASIHHPQAPDCASIIESRCERVGILVPFETEVA